MNTKNLFLLVLVISALVLLFGCVKLPSIADNKTNAGQGNGSGVTTPIPDGSDTDTGVPETIDVAARKKICSEMTDGVGDCLTAIAVDTKDESICANMGEAEFKAMFEADSHYHLDAVNPAKWDSDNDRLSDVKEAEQGTDKNDPDSDNDGLFDGQEVWDESTDPKNPDSDGDGLSDGGEVIVLYTSPNDASENEKDSDKDGMPDSWEKKYGLNPNDASDAALDSDSDGIKNAEEFGYGAGPVSADSDNDGYKDKEEIDLGVFPDSNLYTPYDVDYTGDGTPDKHEEEIVAKNKGEELATSKNSCYAVLAISLNDKAMCGKSGWIGGSGVSTDARVLCENIINGLNSDDPKEKEKICKNFAATLNLAKVKC